jgi:hypothetical protein
MHSLVQLRCNPSGSYAAFLVGIECLTKKPIYSSAQRFHDSKISGYSSTLPEKLSDDDEVNPLEVSLDQGTLLPVPPCPSLDSAEDISRWRSRFTTAVSSR